MNEIAHLYPYRAYILVAGSRQKIRFIRWYLEQRRKIKKIRRRGYRDNRGQDPHRTFSTIRKNLVFILSEMRVLSRAVMI